jgi:hypothetical protein
MAASVSRLLTPVTPTSTEVDVIKAIPDNVPLP